MLFKESFVYSASYVSLEFLIKSVRVFYAFACLILIIRYKHLLQNTKLNFEKVHLNWLKGLVIGFMVVMLSETLVASAKVINLF